MRLPSILALLLLMFCTQAQTTPGIGNYKLLDDPKSVVDNQVFIKLNNGIDEYYLLYLSPITPYFSEAKGIMLPVEAMSSFLNMSVDLRPDSKSAQITHNSTYIYISEGESIYQARKRGEPKNFALEGVLEWIEGDLLMPASVLIEAFSLEASWDAGLKVLEFKDPAIMSQYFRINRMFAIEGEYTDALTPISVKSAPEDDVTMQSHIFQITFLNMLDNAERRLVFFISGKNSSNIKIGDARHASPRSAYIPSEDLCSAVSFYHLECYVETTTIERVLFIMAQTLVNAKPLQSFEER